jgi:hypothetical protein
MATEQELDEVNEYANVMVDVMNHAAITSHPATAITALQEVVSRVLETYGIPTSLFMERVDRTRKVLRG